MRILAKTYTILHLLVIKGTIHFSTCILEHVSANVYDADQKKTRHKISSVNPQWVSVLCDAATLGALREQKLYPCGVRFQIAFAIRWISHAELSIYHLIYIICVVLETNLWLTLCSQCCYSAIVHNDVSTSDPFVFWPVWIVEKKTNGCTLSR